MGLGSHQKDIERVPRRRRVARAFQKIAIHFLHVKRKPFQSNMLGIELDNLRLGAIIMVVAIPSDLRISTEIGKRE